MDDEISGAKMDKERELRQKKIDTAVKFLQNPRVRQTPIAQRRSFLQNKGLTADEIEQAVAQSGTGADENAFPVAPAQESARYGPIALPLPPPPVPWRSYVGAAVIGGGLGYILVNLIKNYIVPLIFDLQEKDEKLEKLEMSVVQLNTNVTATVGSVQTTLESVQKMLVEQQTKIRQLSCDLASTQDKLTGLPTDSYSVGDLKAEIVSLKGLLLNRKQFPSPVIGSTPAQGIPAWQRTIAPATGSLLNNGQITDSRRQTDDITDQGTSTIQQDHSTMNGHSSDLDGSKEDRSASLHSFGSGSETDTDTPSTVKSNISVIDKSMNDAILLDTEADISNDTSVSSLSDASASASFNEASIAFSSTCIKIQSEPTSLEETTTVIDSKEVD